MLLKLAIFGGYTSVLPLILLYTDGTFEKWLLYLHALGISCIVYFLFHFESLMSEEIGDSKNELYGLKHLVFNLNVPPKTLWFNMGLWDADKDLTFPQACENLVHAVVSKFNIRPNSAVLDVGFGCGDSCIVLADQYKAKVTGITNELSQWNIANNRILDLNLKEQVSLLHGSADNIKELVSTSDVYDFIISIDSAYHYNTRWTFLESAFSHLRSNGGMIGLYDLTIDPEFRRTATAPQKQMIKMVCDALHIPIKNLVTPEEYEEKLVELGYKNINVESLDRNLVFGGLSKSFQDQYKNAIQYGIGVSLKNTIVLKLSGYLFSILATKPWIIPVIVEASKE